MLSAIDALGLPGKIEHRELDATFMKTQLAFYVDHAIYFMLTTIDAF